MDRLTLFQLLQEEFDTHESAIAKYGSNCLRVRDPSGLEHQLELRVCQKPIFRDTPLSWDISLLAQQPVVPIEVCFKYMPPDGSTLLPRFGLNNDRGLLDREHIRERLELLPRAEFLGQIQRGQSRKSGRTTEMMLDALVNLQTQEFILIDSANATESLRIVRQIRRHATTSGILSCHADGERQVKVLNGFTNLRGYNPDRYKIFSDHSKGDLITGAQLSCDRIEAERRQAVRGYVEFAVSVHQVDREHNQPEFRGDRSWAEFHIWQEQIERRYREQQHFINSNLKDSSKPIVCQGCKNYNGSSYGGNLLICGMYPYGCDTDVCPDWEEN